MMTRSIVCAHLLAFVISSSAFADPSFSCSSLDGDVTFEINHKWSCIESRVKEGCLKFVPTPGTEKIEYSAVPAFCKVWNKDRGWFMPSAPSEDPTQFWGYSLLEKQTYTVKARLSRFTTEDRGSLLANGIEKEFRCTWQVIYQCGELD